MFKAIRFDSFARGNYGSGNFEHTDYILGSVLFRSPAVTLPSESYGEDNYQDTSKGVWGVLTPEGKVILALWEKRHGKGGRGCDPYHDVDWRFIDTSTMPGLQAEALKGLAPKQVKVTAES